MRTSIAALAALLLILALSPAPAAPAEGPEAVFTDVSVLIGHATNGRLEDAVTLILPGTVLSAADPGWPSDISKLKAQIQEAYRLEKILVQNRYGRLLRQGETAAVPRSDTLDVGVTLVGFNDAVATYRVEIGSGGEMLANPMVSVKRNGQAVVGTRFKSGAEEPYAFIVVESKTESPAEPPKDGISPPKLIEKVSPIYPEECKDERVEGAVIVEALIRKDGTAEVVKVIRTPDPRLGQAATDAVNKWRFEPARDKTNQPVNVSFTITVMFKLDPGQDKEPAR